MAQGTILLRNIIDFKFLLVTLYLKSLGFQIFRREVTPEAMDLASRLLQYSPNLRCTAVRVKPFIIDFLEICAFGLLPF